MQNKDIILISQQSWEEEIRTNPRAMTYEFMKGNRVLYINPPLDINTLLKSSKTEKVKKRLRVLMEKEEGLVKVYENVWVYTPGIICLSINWISSPAIFKNLSKINTNLYGNSINKAAKSIGFKNDVLFIDGLLFLALGLRKILKPTTGIYYIRDFVIGLEYFKTHGPWIEERLMRDADVVVGNSAYLADYAKKYNPNSFDIGQGCELGLYNPDKEYPTPDDLKNIPHPIIGYTGFLTVWRLDIDLLIFIAKSKPEWSLVLVGPEDDTFKQSELHQLPNVYFLGGKPPEQLPMYVIHFDVTINPQIVNEMTVGNYPLKTDEYLAMGKQSVATHTRAMEMFSDYVYLAKDKQEWVAHLEKAIAANTETPLERERIKFARSHTWQASVQAIYDAVETTLAKPAKEAAL